jgi:UDP-glucose 4-epimerase
MNKIIVTGGAGYIGSFIVRELKSNGFDPIIIDNFSQGHRKAVESFPIEEIDLVTEPEKLTNFFIHVKPTGVIHMASFIQMGESFKNPGKYFKNNLLAAINILESMAASETNKIVFSSSAGIFGNPQTLPIKENDIKNPENPYGETKLMIERILYWYEKAYGIRNIAIRYFNAAGASLDGSIGEDHPQESHLIPILIKKALAGKEAQIFGEDYDTPDGTCVRDYIHVLDLASAHILAIKALIEGRESNSYNAGSGKGYSNKEIVNMIRQVSGLDLKTNFADRRAGDAATLYASIEKIEKDLGWKPKYSLKEIIETAYSWHKNNPEGYK